MRAGSSVGWPAEDDGLGVDATRLVSGDRPGRERPRKTYQAFTTRRRRASVHPNEDVRWEMSAALMASAEVVRGRSFRYRRLLWGSRPDNWRHAWLGVAGDDVAGGGGLTTGLQETLKGDQQRSTGKGGLNFIHSMHCTSWSSVVPTPQRSRPLGTVRDTSNIRVSLRPRPRQWAPAELRERLGGPGEKRQQRGQRHGGKPRREQSP